MMQTIYSRGGAVIARTTTHGALVELRRLARGGTIAVGNGRISAYTSFRYGADNAPNLIAYAVAGA